jgi:hypothetical protein
VAFGKAGKDRSCQHVDRLVHEITFLQALEETLIRCLQVWGPEPMSKYGW